jgi:hypothetical protein
MQRGRLTGLAQAGRMGHKVAAARMRLTLDHRLDGRERRSAR